ncbi:hypothetical protein C8R42DRAFT_640205 [Lentinula raphanica]|nr:hypothetical protein C8R42DRAFT_640205 [Lentinula raphanica]
MLGSSNQFKEIPDTDDEGYRSPATMSIKCKVVESEYSSVELREQMKEHHRRMREKGGTRKRRGEKGKGRGNEDNKCQQKFPLHDEVERVHLLSHRVIDDEGKHEDDKREGSRREEGKGRREKGEGRGKGDKSGWKRSVEGSREISWVPGTLGIDLSQRDLNIRGESLPRRESEKDYWEGFWVKGGDHQGEKEDKQHEERVRRWEREMGQRGLKDASLSSFCPSQHAAPHVVATLRRKGYARSVKDRRSGH